MRGAVVVVGATGGIGRAVAEALVARGVGQVYAFSRQASSVLGAIAGQVDVTDEASLEAAAASLREPVTLVIVATGLLTGAPARPERRVAELTPEGLAQSFAVNAIGPAIVAKHFTPLFPRDHRAVFAALSARVGSIGDNQLGGWWGYRNSKAALNMIVRCLAVELARTHPSAICAAIHPGTVDTTLSLPFQRGVPPDRLFTPAHSAERVLDVLASLTPEQSGGFFAYDGSAIPY